MNPNERLFSLDALRGFDMLFIMGFAGLVSSLCALWPNLFTDALAAQMHHVLRTLWPPRCTTCRGTD